VRRIRSAGPAGLVRALVIAGLYLPLLWGPALAQGANQAGQTTPSSQELIERLREIGGEVGASQAPAPKLSEEQVRSRLQDELGVEVLDLRVVDPNGPPAYAVKVMNPPGNYSAAFLVSTLLVDGDTGQVLGEMRRQPSSADPDLLPESRRPGVDASGAEVRRRTYQ
jgi:hypothetical protein